VPGRSAWLGSLGAGTAVVTGASEHFPHDPGRVRHGLTGQFGLDGPAFAGPGQSRLVRPVQFAVRQVITHADPAVRPHPPLAAPARSGAPVRRGVLQRQPDRGDGPDVRQPGRGRRHGGVPQAAGGQPGPGDPDPRRARAEPGRLGQAQVPPPRRDPPGPVHRDPQDDGELVKLDSVHLGGEDQRLDVAPRQRRQRLPLPVAVGHNWGTLRPLRPASPGNLPLAAKNLPPRSGGHATSSVLGDAVRSAVTHPRKV
jgi:hypothetical protein